MCSKFSSFVFGAALGAAACYFGATKEGREKANNVVDKVKAFLNKPEEEDPFEEEELENETV